jgi:hypothetical protein
MKHSEAGRDRRSSHMAPFCDCSSRMQFRSKISDSDILLSLLTNFLAYMRSPLNVQNKPTLQPEGAPSCASDWNDIAIKSVTRLSAIGHREPVAKDKHQHTHTCSSHTGLRP